MDAKTKTVSPRQGTRTKKVGVPRVALKRVEVTRGRPKTRLEKLKPIPTRCPESLHKYLQAIRPFKYPSLTELYEDMLERFIATRPWEHGVEWRKPRTRLSKRDEYSATTGWIQINVQVQPALKARVVALAVTEGVSQAAIAYTAMYWWAMFIMPASQVRAMSTPAIPPA